MPKRPDHRIARAFERYGVVIDRLDLHNMERQISEGVSVCVGRYFNGEHHMVRHGQTVLICVAKTNGFPGYPKSIVTFLPPDALVAGRRAEMYGGALKARRVKKRRDRLARSQPDA